ncbi:hypothetical protein [Microbacterium sp. NPDC076895]|uniref:hypothetical protein n=1 Tax=Microbacterium sp. NPDC076895 TaxID=3154957 RepID=UPI003416BA14
MSTNDSTPAPPNENVETEDRDNTMVLEVVASEKPSLFRPPAPEKPGASASASDDASVPLTPPAAEEPPMPVRVAELTPAETGVEAPRTRWAAVVWGLFFAAVAIGGLWLLSEPSRPSDAVEWAVTLDAATGVAILILGLGVILLVAGAAGLLRRTQRRRTAD